MVSNTGALSDGARTIDTQATVNAATFNSASVIDQCSTLYVGSVYCQPNFTDEWMEHQIFTDYSQADYPMTLVASVPATNFNVSGTADCGMILYDQQAGTPHSSYCGVFDATYPTFGGCSHMDIDEVAQLAVCGNQTNRTEPLTNGASPLKSTMVIPLNGALFGQAMEISSGIKAASGGITFAAQ